MLKNLERIKAQSIAYYVCSGDDLSELKYNNFEERYLEQSDKFYIACEDFVSRICDSMPYYSKIDNHKKELLLENFLISIRESINELNNLHCEIGIKIGFNLALELGLKSYKDKRGI